ncbi:MAG: hypothetical protein CMN56_10770 [Sneathiella sp.]|uniref:copper chaperone PCu(A)C n=1 Tax=Sneathiella sp. TaxID=1964365 RepID=UPI000C524691|nr:copper chaperone PCu(A)C [Sneathiella sp.]MAZ03611.1 hypothetical protein [Sneathiella sp.]|tara:strand:- start:195 stop:683 length:489 start_codon:yes stop_codon:yes gene_type:complete
MKYIKALPLVLLAIVMILNAESDKFMSHATEINGMEVMEPWARERPANAMMGGAFLTLKNSEGEADRLVSASSPVADKVEIHDSVMKDGVMSMMRIEELVVEPGETVMLKPGGFHVMLMGLKKPLTKGTEFPLTLNFARAGEITVTVHVKDAGDMGATHKHN